MATKKTTTASDDQDQAVQVRLLRDNEIDGISYKINQVVEFSVKRATSLHDDGAVDVNPEAVAYCLSNGAEVVVHVVPSGTNTDGADASAAE